MLDDAIISTLKQLTERAAARGPSVMTPVRALRHAVPKAAEQGYQMPLAVKELRESKEGLQDFCDSIDESRLMALLSARDGAAGLVLLDHGLLAALIEVQTTGRVVPGDAVARKPTRTDITMCDGFVNQVFELIEALLPADGRGPWFYGYRMGAQLDSLRKIALVLDDAPLLVYRIGLDIGQGAKTGELVLALPANLRATMQGGAMAPDSGDWRAALRSTVLGSEVRIDAVLHRLRLTLADLHALEVGQMLTVPKRALAGVRLEAPDRRQLGTARLGQSQGARAVRLNAEPDGPAQAVPPVEPAVSELPEPTMPLDPPDQTTGAVPPDPDPDPGPDPDIGPTLPDRDMVDADIAPRPEMPPERSLAMAETDGTA